VGPSALVIGIVREGGVIAQLGDVGDAGPTQPVVKVGRLEVGAELASERRAQTALV